MRIIKDMKSFWLFLPHFIRAPIGFMVWKNLPNSHDIVADLEFDRLENGRNISFDEIHRRTKFNVEKAFFEIIKKQMKLLKAYGALTVISMIIDIFNLIVILNYFGIAGEEY